MMMINVEKTLLKDDVDYNDDQRRNKALPCRGKYQLFFDLGVKVLLTPYSRILSSKEIFSMKIFPMTSVPHRCLQNRNGGILYSNQ